MLMKTKHETVTRGSGNIFADLDLPNPEELQQSVVSRKSMLTTDDSSKRTCLVCT
jgi:hypothetical protein